MTGYWDKSGKILDVILAHPVLETVNQDIEPDAEQNKENDQELPRVPVMEAEPEKVQTGQKAFTLRIGLHHLQKNLETIHRHRPDDQDHPDIAYLGLLELSVGFENVDMITIFTH
jgi:hypothetical protein